MGNRKLGHAVIGYGGMGSWHATVAGMLPELLEQRGIFDIKPDRCAVAREKGLRAYDSLEELLADPQVDLVTVATPNDTHKDLCIQALQAGKHVVCEKPAALSSAELEQMIHTAEQNHRLFTTHHNRRFDEDFLCVKQLYEQRTLGDVFCIQSRVYGSRGVPGDWRNQKQHGGGMILDWGVHLLDQALLMTDEKMVSVYAVETHVTNDEVDDGFIVTLRTESGLLFQIEVGTSHFIPFPRWYVFGQNGSAEVDWGLKGKIVMVSDWKNKDAVPVVAGAGLTKTMAPRDKDSIREYPLPEIHSDVLDFYRNVVAVIWGEQQSLITPEQMRRVMRLMELVFASAEQNRVIEERI